MIEVIYSGETRKPKTQAEETLASLKNIRQIGNAGGSTRIYVEDCVMSFLNRQMQKKDPQVAALVGKESQMDNITYLFVSGALLSDGITVKGESLEFTPQAFPKLYEDMESYFPESGLLGWYLPAYSMIGKYASTLGQNSHLFLLEDPTESEELFYLWQQNHLVKQSGYYVYYQRNEQMKSYMQSCREKLAEETVPVQESGSAQKTWPTEKKIQESREEFIDDYQEKEEPLRFFVNPPSRLTAFLYASSTVLAIVVLVIGITLINNYEKMYEMQEAIETIASVIRNEDTEQMVDQVQNDNEVDTAETSAPESETSGSALDDSDAGETVDTTALESQGNFSQEENAGSTFTGQVYTIQEGDTLASISRKIYQTTDKIEEIKLLNQGLNENELIVGEKIILP